MYLVASSACSRGSRCGRLQCPRGSGGVLTVCAANCVISLVSTCLYYDELHRLRAYPFFAAQLNACLGVLVAGLGLLALGFAPGPGAALGEAEAGAALLPPQVRLGWQRWANLAWLLALQNTLEIASIQRIGNDNLPPILQQAVVPLTLALSSSLLHTSYTRAQLLGATLVVVGVALGFTPIWLNAGPENKAVNGTWSAVFLLSRLPQALANVLAEGSLRGHHDFAGIFRATLFTQLLAVPFNFMFALVAAPFEKGATGRTVFEDYAGGARCLVKGVDAEGTEAGCAQAWRAALMFAVPGAAYTLSEFQVLQRASAATYFLLAALQLPLQDTMLSLPVFQGGLHAAFQPALGFSIFVIAVGLTVYGLDVASGPDEVERDAGRRAQLG